MTAVWVILNLELIINHERFGYITSDILTLTSIAIIPLIAAIVIGNILHKYIKQEIFLKITYTLLLISGVALLIS